jgi:hypothetical protein
MESLIKSEINIAKNIRQQRNMGQNRSSDEAYSFIIKVLKIFHPNFSEADIAKAITDDQKDLSIDAVCIPSDKKKNIEIFNFSSAKPTYTEIDTFANNIDRYVLKKQKITNLSKFITDKIPGIRKRCKKHQNIEIYVCWKNLKKIGEECREPLERLKKNYDSIKDIFFFNGNEIISKFIEMEITKAKYDWSFDIMDKEQLIKKDQHGKIKSLIARVPLIKIINLRKFYKEHYMELFEKNVREFQGRKDLAEGIEFTLKKYPEEFYIFNNGITFSCDDISTRVGSHFNIKNPQVINGCQTVDTSFNFFERNLGKRDLINRLKKASVLCRFYSLPDSMIEKVCQSTNTQIPIRLSDLRSNDRIQKIIESLFELENNIIKYKRKGTTGKKNYFTLPQLSQWIYSCKFEKPAEAKDKKSLLFDLIKSKLYYNIFNEKLDWKDMNTIVEIGIFVKQELILTQEIYGL